MVEERQPGRNLTLRGSRFRATALWLLGLTALPVAMLAARLVYTRSMVHVFVAPNLVLAWLPFGFSYLAVRPGLGQRPSPILERLLRLASCLGWLLFLPNGPYLVTDLLHLRQSQVPLVYDVIMLFSSALCGLVLGLISVRWMQAAVARRLGVWPSRLFAVLALGCAGFGVYLGRYQRWNSWDALLQPAALARGILPLMAHPVQHWQDWAFMLLFTLLLLLAYWPVTVLLGAGAKDQGF
jgi:uncharacterized membrane protein